MFGARWAAAGRELALVTQSRKARVHRDFFPSVDAGLIRLHVRAPPGTRIEATEQLYTAVVESTQSLSGNSTSASPLATGSPCWLRTVTSITTHRALALRVLLLTVP